MSEPLQQRIASALRGVLNPRLATDVLSAEQAANVAVTLDGKVRLQLRLSAQDDATLARDVRQAVERVEGVTEVRVDIVDAAAPAPAATAPKRAALPVMQEPAAVPKGVPAPTPIAYPNLGRIIAVSSGKGGVGKSTVTTNLAVALAQQGFAVGLMDADIYGPNIPRMMGVDAPPAVRDDKIIPLEAHGVKIISLGFLIEKDQPAIWRGPIVMKIVTQFLRDVQWGQLDFLLVDMPPGTGDAQLSLVQATQVAGAVIVTTPQEVSVGDALRGAMMFRRVGVPVVGIVENMSYFESPETGKPLAIFGSGGGARLANELEVPLLAEIPLYPPVLQAGDAGAPIVIADPNCSASQKLVKLAARVAESVGARPA